MDHARLEGRAREVMRAIDGLPLPESTGLLVGILAREACKLPPGIREEGIAEMFRMAREVLPIYEKEMRDNIARGVNE